MEVFRVVNRRVDHAIIRVVGAFVIHRAVTADLLKRKGAEHCISESRSTHSGVFYGIQDNI